MARVEKEIGKRPRDEERRNWRFKTLRDELDKKKKIEQRKRDIEDMIEDSKDPFKSGRVVKYMAYFLSFILVVVILYVAKDGKIEKNGESFVNLSAQPAPRKTITTSASLTQANMKEKKSLFP